MKFSRIRTLQETGTKGFADCRKGRRLNRGKSSFAPARAQEMVDASRFS